MEWLFLAVLLVFQRAYYNKELKPSTERYLPKYQKWYINYEFIKKDLAKQVTSLSFPYGDKAS